MYTHPLPSNQPSDLRAAAARIGALRQELGVLLGDASQQGDLVAVEQLHRTFMQEAAIYDGLKAAVGPTGIFLAKYGVEVTSAHTVSFVIPKGHSRLEILHEAQALVEERELIAPEALKTWAVDDSFTSSAKDSELLHIDGHVDNLLHFTRPQQEEMLAGRGLGMPTLQDLAVAFATFYVATGQPLFLWYHEEQGWSYAVRARAGVLIFDESGLDLDYPPDDCVEEDLTAALLIARSKQSTSGAS